MTALNLSNPTPSANKNGDPHWRYDGATGRLFRVHGRHVRYSGASGPLSDDAYLCSTFDAEGTPPQVRPVDGKFIRSLPLPSAADPAIQQIAAQYRRQREAA